MKLAIGLLTLALLSGCATNPLSTAAFKGDLPAVNTALGRGADPNFDTLGMGSPLHMAVLSGSEKIAFNLIGHGAKIDKQAYADGPTSKMKFGDYIPQLKVRRSFGTPIMISAAISDEEMFMFLVGRGANIELKVSDHRFDIAEEASALHFGAAGGNPEIVSYLIDAGLDVNGKISKWDNIVGLATPIHFAVMRGNTKAAKLLLEAGADVNALYKDGNNTILDAARLDPADENAPDMVRLLIEHGVNIELQDDSDYTALHAAANKNAPEIIRLLVEHGADTEAQNDSGYTALSLAAFRGNMEAAEVLLVNGASLSTDSDKVRLSYVHHLAADLLQESDPERALSLYVKAVDLYRESIPELEKKAQAQVISDAFWVAIANVASASITSQQATVQAKQLSSISALNAQGPVTYTHYYTVPILTGAPWPNTHEAHAVRSKLGADRIRAIIHCAESGGSTLLACGKKAGQIKSEVR